MRAFVLLFTLVVATGLCLRVNDLHRQVTEMRQEHERQFRELREQIRQKSP